MSRFLILFWNCQGIRPKRKGLELYLKENTTDIIALSETFLSKKHNFRIPDYDTIGNDRSTGLGGGVKHGLVINKEYRNDDFSLSLGNKSWNFLTTKTLLWLPFTAEWKSQLFTFPNH